MSNFIMILKYVLPSIVNNVGVQYVYRNIFFLVL